MHHQPDRKRKDTLDYLHSMLGQLRAMAETEGCDMLAYLIDMAQIEARDLMLGEPPAGRRRPDAIV